MSPKCLGQCNHIRAKPRLVCRPMQSALMDDKYWRPDLFLLRTEQCQKCPNLSALLRNLCFWYATLISEPKTAPREIYLDTGYLRRRGIPKLQRLNTTINQTVTPDTLDYLRKDSRWIQRPNVWISDVAQEVLDRNE
ncbi:hypothetical protein ACTXT7_013547 [Hymenolepis weldensis]